MTRSLDYPHVAHIDLLSLVFLDDLKKEAQSLVTDSKKPMPVGSSVMIESKAVKNRIRATGLDTGLCVKMFKSE